VTRSTVWEETPPGRKIDIPLKGEELSDHPRGGETISPRTPIVFENVLKERKMETEKNILRGVERVLFFVGFWTIRGIVTQFICVGPIY